MNRHEMRRQFGRQPSLEAILVWSIQQALKGYRTRHPDGKRQRRARLEAKARRAARRMQP